MANNKLTIKVTDVAYYNNRLVYPNEIIKNYVGEIPTWATLANGKDGKPDENKTPEGNEGKEPDLDNVGQDNKENGEGQASDASLNIPSEQQEGEQQKLDTVGQNDETAKEKNVPAEKTEAELQDELDKLLDESVAQGIILENADKLTIAEQIAELKKLLGKE